MALIAGYSGIVTSWGGANSHLIDGTGNRPATYNITETCDDADSTYYVASLLGHLHIPLLRSWSGSIDCVRPTPIGGYGASIALSAANAYITNAFEFDLNLSCAVLPATIFGASATTSRYKQWLPGLWEFSANWRAYVDGTQALIAAGHETQITATFTLSSGVTIACLGYCNQLAIANDVKGQPVATMGFRGSPSTTGIVLADASNPADNNTPLAIQGATPLVMTNATGRTMTGDAFMSSLAVKCPVDGQITTTIGVQGTGTLTQA